MTKAQQIALVRVSEGKNIQREHAYNLQRMGYSEMKRSVSYLTPKGKEYIDNLNENSKGEDNG